MRTPKYPIELTPDEREYLLGMARKHTEKQGVVVRVKIILMADEGKRNKDIAAELKINVHVVTKWRKRWLEKSDELIEKRLQDLPRPGAPDTFTPEQLCLIIALACEDPQDHGRPITHWTHRELADEAIKQGIVATISAHHLGRLLKKTTCNHIEAATG